MAATVTVVTTDGPAGMAGATVSAFTSLSADPPSVLVCLKADSRIAQTVRDNGVGVANSQQAQIFELFARGHGAAGGGEGIGLTITRRLVERNGGECRCGGAGGLSRRSIAGRECA